MAEKFRQSNDNGPKAQVRNWRKFERDQSFKKRHHLQTKVETNFGRDQSFKKTHYLIIEYTTNSKIRRGNEFLH